MSESRVESGAASKSSFQEMDLPVHNEKSAQTSRIAQSVHLGLNVLAILASVTILGTAGDSLSNYNHTSLGSEYIVAIWPNEFDIRPTVALVICSTIILVASVASLAGIKVPSLQRNTLIHSAFSFLLPTISLIAALIGTSFFYGVNASNTNHSLQSWSCEWSSIQMDTKPHWGTLCRESKTALYLTVILIPVEVLVLGTAAWGVLAQKKERYNGERKASPALS